VAGALRATAAASALALWAAAAAAEGLPATPGLTDDAVAERLRFIEERLEESRRHAQLWYWSWMTINAGSAIGLGIAAGLAQHEDDQVNNGVQAGVAAIGVADLLLRPLNARFGAAPIAGLPEATREERLAKLRAAETLLRDNAERAEERTSWTMHAANVALNGVAGGLIAGFGRPSDGLIAFGTGTVGGVINMLTQPWAPATDWQDYQARFGGAAANREAWRVSINPLADRGAMLALQYSW
jgi:hypothetical protein